MLAVIFMVRLEAAARALRDTVPSSTSRFVSFNLNSQFKEGRKRPLKAVPEEPVTKRDQQHTLDGCCELAPNSDEAWQGPGASENAARYRWSPAFQECLPP
jgi:hypothetical protein